MRRPLVVGALLVFATGQRAEAQLKDIDVVSCPAADSAVGPSKKKIKGRVRTFRQDAEDVTHLTTAAPRGPLRVMAAVKFYGERPTNNPELQLSVMNRDAAGRVLQAMTGEPRVESVLDDSTTLEPAQVKRGSFVGPEGAPVNVPVSVLLKTDQYLTVVRARRAKVRVVGVQDVALSNDELMDLRHLYRASVCPPK